MIGEKVIIRKYVPTDFEQLINIAKTLPEWFTATAIEQMQADFGVQQGFVALHKSRIVGFVTFFVSGSVAQIGWIGISPEFHRCGIGKNLITQLVLSLKSKGVRELRVHTLSDAIEYKPYESTREFYHKLGFKDFQRITQHNPECPELLVLVRRIQ
jgi:ribosomal protein S18 acetylase RimI-like enzyme